MEAAATQLARAVLLQLGPGDALWEWQGGQAEKRWVRASLGVRKALCWSKTHCWFKSSLRRCRHRRMPCAPLNKERVGSTGGEKTQCFMPLPAAAGLPSAHLPRRMGSPMRQWDAYARVWNPCYTVGLGWLSSAAKGWSRWQ